MGVTDEEHDILIKRFESWGKYELILRIGLLESDIKRFESNIQRSIDFRYDLMRWINRGLSAFLASQVFSLSKYSDSFSEKLLACAFALFIYALVTFFFSMFFFRKWEF